MDKSAVPNLNFSSEEFERIARQGTKPQIITLMTELDTRGHSPLEVYSLLRKGRGYLLESAETGGQQPLYSMIGVGPCTQVLIDKNGLHADCVAFGAEAATVEGSDPVAILRALTTTATFHGPGEVIFPGGLVGYLAYETAFSLFSPLEGKGHVDTDSHLGRFLYSPCVVFFDHTHDTASVLYSTLLTPESDPGENYRNAAAAIAETKARIERKHPGQTEKPERFPAAGIPVTTQSSMTKEEYEAAVQKTQEEIMAGEILQAVISRRISCVYNRDPLKIYRRLRETNPSPYMYFLEFGDQTIVGSSPEMLVRVEGKRAATVPIAGTRPRGATPEEDQRLAEELLGDKKERAEHIMLVDLARNDIGRVSSFGTVSVTRCMEVDKFSHVQHIVSRVEGELRDDCDGFDALASCFPAGTVSGAPKIRAIEIIGAIEQSERGPYAGATGFAAFNGNLEFAITIRTVVVEGGEATVQAGAGIVADSDPEKEYFETENKARGLISAIMEAGP
jgi:anthranilate synthase component 1